MSKPRDGARNSLNGKIMTYETYKQRLKRKIKT